MSSTASCSKKTALGLLLIALVGSVTTGGDARASRNGVHATTSPARLTAPDVSPGTFRKVASGVALIKTYRCNGARLGQGSGFLIGTSVVMTARHVVKGACRVRIRVSGDSFDGQRVVSWYGGGASPSAADLSTIKLDRDASGFVFRVRSSPLRVGMNLGAVGHPLGNRLSLNQGRLIERGKLNGAPLLAVRMLGAEGASGSPFIDNEGRVVGILQAGLGSEDVLGQRTSGVVIGLDLVRWWGPRARLDLCRAYPKGGIAGCPGTSPTPPPTTETVRVTAANMSATEDGPPQSAFPWTPQFVAHLYVEFANATRQRHAFDSYAVSPTGTRYEQCGGTIGVGWEAVSCAIELESPEPGSWRVEYLIDGRQRAVGFQITASAPPPPAAPNIRQCWSQDTGGSSSNWNPAPFRPST